MMVRNPSRDTHAVTFDDGLRLGPAKIDLNRREHGVTFDSASTVFQDPWALVAFDSEDDKRTDGYRLGAQPTGTLW